MEFYIRSKCTGDLYLLNGENDRFKRHCLTPKFDWFESMSMNMKDVFEGMIELRAIKTESELEMMRKVNKISADAHKYVMKRVKPGMYEF
jgi:Xaa-Pro aminopeptidase